MASDAHLVLVLDDYHVIYEFSIHQALDFLFEHLPPPAVGPLPAAGLPGGMHVVLLSRTDPPMPLGRLRVLRELTEIREADLRFTLEEKGVFLNERMALALTGQDVADLEATAEASPAATFSAGQIAHHARAVRVYVAVQRGEPDLVIELARAALKALPENAVDEPRVVRGAVTLGLGIGHFYLGQIEAAYRALQSALPLNQRDGNRYAALSCIYYLITSFSPWRRSAWPRAARQRSSPCWNIWSRLRVVRPRGPRRARGS